MRITDLLKACSIELNGTPGTKEETIREMVSLMVKAGNIADQDEYMEGVFAREEEGTTGIGEGIAIPHAKNDAVRAPGLAAMVIRNGVDYDSKWRQMDPEEIKMSLHLRKLKNVTVSL